MRPVINMIRPLFSFGVVGIVTTVISTVAYETLLLLSIQYLVANMLAFVIGLIISYLLNMKFTFSAPITLKSSWMFTVARLITLGVQSFGLWVLSAHFSIAPSWSMVILTVPVTTMSYLLTKSFIRSRREFAT